MSLRRAAKRDANEDRIVSVYETAGAFVQKLSETGVPDLLVSFLDELHLIECKVDNADLTPAQKRWHKAWRGKKPEIVRNEAQAAKTIRTWLQQFAERQRHAPNLEDDMAKADG